MALDDNDNASFLFTGLEIAQGDVVITFFHKNDNGANGYDEFEAAGIAAADLSASTENAVCGVFATDSVTIEETNFNDSYLGDSSSLLVAMQYDDFEDNTCPTAKLVSINLKYQEAGDCLG